MHILKSGFFVNSEIAKHIFVYIYINKDDWNVLYVLFLEKAFRAEKRTKNHFRDSCGPKGK